MCMIRAVKVMTRKQVESAKRRAELAAANLMGDESRAEDYASMSIEEYAAQRGIEIKNPNLSKGESNMASRIKQLEEELDMANRRIQELEDERLDALEALGVEIIEDEEGEDEGDDEGDGDDED